MSECSIIFIGNTLLLFLFLSLTINYLIFFLKLIAHLKLLSPPYNFSRSWNGRCHFGSTYTSQRRHNGTVVCDLSCQDSGLSSITRRVRINLSDQFGSRRGRINFSDQYSSGINSAP